MYQVASRLVAKAIELYRKAPANSNLFAKIGSVFGYTVATAESVVAAMKANPLTAAFVIYETYGIGNEMLQELLAEDSALRETFEALTYKQDVVTDDIKVSDLPKFADEFDLIERGIAYFGSLNRYLEMKRVLEVHSDVVRLYMAVK